MNAINNNVGSKTEAGSQGNAEVGTSRRFYLPSGSGMCVLSIMLQSEPAEKRPESVGGATTEGGPAPNEGKVMVRREATPTKRNRKKTTKQLVRVLLADGKPVDGRSKEADGSLKVVYLPKGEVYNQKKHGTGVRFNRFFHKPLKSLPVNEEQAQAS
jgi:hypothetical protein